MFIVGDFSLHCELNNAPGVKVHVTEPKHMKGQMLCLVITHSFSSIVSSTTAYHSSISDHYSVVFRLSSASPVSIRAVLHRQIYYSRCQNHGCPLRTCGLINQLTSYFENECLPTQGTEVQ